MFIVFETDKMAIMSQPRCGHTVLSQFLNVTEEQTSYHLEKWANSPNRIVILRHPIQRLNSAIKTYYISLGELLDSYDRSEDKDQFIQSLHPNPQWIEYVKRMIALPRLEAREFNIFKMHSMPYMRHIKDYDFKFINFDKMETYFPKYSESYNQSKISPILNERSYKINSFPINQYFTEAEFNEEMDLYHQFLEQRTELTVDEWNELTS